MTSSPPRIIIAGHRRFADYALLDERCTHFTSQITDPITVISGHAPGADSLGERWAVEHHLDLEIYPADWDRHGRSAGPIRNRQMAEVATHLIAFLAPGSRGTRSMISIASELRIPTRIVHIQ